MENFAIEPFISNTMTNVQTDDIEKVIHQYQSHPNILKIKENVILPESFKFKDINSKDILREILGLNPKKLVSKMTLQLKY